ncbi:MAG: nucleotidyltransferase domain-containing protein [Nanoarchaeota archaeon]
MSAKSKKNTKKNSKTTSSKKGAHSTDGKGKELVLDNSNVMTKDELKAQYEVLPKEMREKFDKVKPKLEKLTKLAIEKFDDYIQGVALLPDRKDESGKLDTETINTFVLIDDSDSKKMSKIELKVKLGKILENIATDVDKKIKVDTVLLSELWQACYDQKLEMINIVSTCAPVFDKGILSAVKISEVHKSMTLKKFEKYIVSYCIAGAFTKGRITQQSDIDVFVVIDDTDVKKMTRAELKDKLRTIIISMGYEAKQITGVNRDFHIQVYILTDFWDNLKEANPVIFDLLRDGIPLYDRGIFMPWKQLLLMGKIRPSEEAIDMFMSSGEQIQGRIKYKLKEIAMEDIFLSIQTPSQAALMTYGLPPPAPKETPKVMEEIFVKKEKILEKKYVDILTEIIKTRKDIEHGVLKNISGSKIDDLLKKSEDYLSRIKALFKEIEAQKNIASINELHDSAVTAVRDSIIASGIDSVKEENMQSLFKNHLIDTGILPHSVFSTFKKIIKAKSNFESGKLSKNEVVKIKKEYNTFIKELVEYIQRKRAKDIDRSKIRIKYGNKFGEVIVFGRKAYVVHDLDAEEREVSVSKLDGSGALQEIKKSSMEELEEELSKNAIFDRIFIKEKLFESLKKIFGENIEIMMK